MQIAWNHIYNIMCEARNQVNRGIDNIFMIAGYPREEEVAEILEKAYKILQQGVNITAQRIACLKCGKLLKEGEKRFCKACRIEHNLPEPKE